MAGGSTVLPQKTYTELEEDPPQDDMKSLGLFMDAVPFQTLSTIADGLEQRLDNLASAMFEPLVEEADLDTRSEVSSNRGGRFGGGDGSGTPGLDDSSPSRSSIRKADRGSVAFMTAVDVESPGSRDGTGVPQRSAMPIKSVEDVRVDYDKLLRGPMAPPNCEPVQLLLSIWLLRAASNGVQSLRVVVQLLLDSVACIRCCCCSAAVYFQQFERVNAAGTADAIGVG